MADEFYSFEKALQELRLKDEELKRLVSENVIRAFRDGDRMKLRREDVEKLKTELGSSSGTEELVFEDDSGEDPGMATVPLAEAETMVEAPAPPAPERAPARPAAASARASVAAKKGAAPRPRPAARRKEEVVEEVTTDSALLKAVLAVTALILVVSLFVALDVAKGQPGSISKVFANLFAS
ncbi:MAG TPA: hypothetical protein VKE69_03680 [Planctomycetota bacterium]|nr:hypothetical protein [Planctomycetota bacterium]